MISKPAVSGRVPIIVTTSQTVSVSEREIIALHYVNNTAGVGQVRVTDGSGATAGVVLGAAVVGGSDDFCPTQPMKFNKIVVTFDTGTGYLSILTN